MVRLLNIKLDKKFWMLVLTYVKSFLIGGAIGFLIYVAFFQHVNLHCQLIKAGVLTIKSSLCGMIP
jgi:hypothetical protein